MCTRRVPRLIWWIALVSVVAAVTAACGDDDGGSAQEPVIDPGDGGEYAPVIDPSDFVEAIDNPYLPLVPGSRWAYEDDESERIEVLVTDERRQVMGISATVVRDTVFEDDQLIEDTLDWFAQDRDGNVWYLGEDSKEYEDGELVSTAGSWEAGVDGAFPGIVMLAQPRVGEAYRQEYYKDEAEDVGEVVEVGVSQTVAAGAFDDVVVVREWNPLEPDVVEDKYHAPGVGVVFESVVQGGEGQVELVEYTPGS